MDEAKIDSKVIILAGLDNGGKTSIAFSLRGIKNLPLFSTTKPTKGRTIVTVNSYDSVFKIWDLGGQKSYRDDYIKNFETYLICFDKFIYVFDIQDVERYDLALEYCEKIFDLLKENVNPNDVDISIFLHKYDPDLSITNPDITKEVVNDLKNKIKTILDKTGFFYQIFETTIYAIFEKSVSD
jgi:GTPase SAR1 family protein